MTAHLLSGTAMCLRALKRSVIDDGSHMAADIRKSFTLIWPAVKWMYVVEDLGTQYYEKHGDQYLKGEQPFTDYLHSECDFLAKNYSRLRICWEPGQVYLYKTNGKFYG